MSKAAANREGRTGTPGIRPSLASVSETRPTLTATRPPSHLSARSRAEFLALNRAYVFSLDERLTLVRKLEWQDRSDMLAAEAEELVGRERLARIRASVDCATTAARIGKGLKYTTADGAPRRIRRPRVV